MWGFFYCLTKSCVYTVAAAAVSHRRWRNPEHWRRFPPSFGCDDSILLDSCTLHNLLYMWAAPALLAAAALGLLVLRAVLCGGEGHVGHKSGAAARWSALLLPPRYV
jgi:hypothetical protein